MGAGDIAWEPRDLLRGEGLQFWCLLFWGSVFLWQGSGPDRDQHSRENQRKLWKEIYPKDESIWTKDWYLTHFLVRVGDLSQFSCSVVSNPLWPHGLQHARLPCPSPTPRVYSNSCPLNQWCHPTISSSVVPFSSCIIPSIRVFPNESVLCIRWPKYWSFSFNISPSNEHPGLISFRMDWLGLLAVQGTLKSLLQHHSSKASILWCSAFFIVQLSHLYMTTGKTIALKHELESRLPGEISITSDMLMIPPLWQKEKRN